jgi:hypothetical protein
MLLLPYLQEIMNVYLRKRKYAAKASGKPKRLSYFHSWLLFDTCWICFRTGESLKESESDSYGFAMAQRNMTKVI